MPVATALQLGLASSQTGKKRKVRSLWFEGLGPVSSEEIQLPPTPTAPRAKTSQRELSQE